MRYRQETTSSAAPWELRLLLSWWPDVLGDIIITLISIMDLYFFFFLSLWCFCFLFYFFRKVFFPRDVAQLYYNHSLTGKKEKTKHQREPYRLIFLMARVEYAYIYIHPLFKLTTIYRERGRDLIVIQSQLYEGRLTNVQRALCCRVYYHHHPFFV